jgi:hypothetical protein
VATRLRTTHQDQVREKIKTSQLINRLQDHALSGKDLSVTQIKAIEVLIRKTLPDLSQVTASIAPADDQQDRSGAQAEVSELFGAPRLVVNNG